MDKSNLQEFLEAANYECREYSGRGMFGKKCLAIRLVNMGIFIHDIVRQATTDAFDTTDDALRNSDKRLRDIANALGTMQLDNLGHDQIAYFPSVQFVRSDE